jgi:hypothetical protein
MIYKIRFALSALPYAKNGHSEICRPAPRIGAGLAGEIPSKISLAKAPSRKEIII